MFHTGCEILYVECHNYMHIIFELWKKELINERTTLHLLLELPKLMISSQLG